MDTNTHPPYTYPDSGNSSPHSVENRPPSFEDQPLPPPSKVKLMVSYNGQIQPRSHDNTLSYLGGDTKILSIDRSVKFSTIYSKLASLTSLDYNSSDVKSGGFSFKYQLPGEDLDSLISVTNDEDLDNMFLEYDRLFHFSPNKPVRLRLFLFSSREQKQPSSSKGGGGGSGSGFSSVSSDHLRVGPDRDFKSPGPGPVDYLFGLDKVSGPVQVPVHLLNEQKTVNEPELLQELNRIKIAALEFQQQKAAVKPPESYQNIPVNNPTNVQVPAGYWQQVEHQQPQFPPQLPPQQMQQFHQQQQPVYVMHAPPQGNMYAPPNQGYYQMQRMSSDVSYVMQQPVYSIPAVSVAAQVAYDSVSGVQVYYGAPPKGGVVTAAVNGDNVHNVMVPSSSGV